MEAFAREVLGCYAAPWRGSLDPRRYAGFSGAQVWKVQTLGGPLCLRASAAHEITAQVRQRHALLNHLAELPFISLPVTTLHGDTIVESQGRVWELMHWMPGQADFHARPTRERLRAATQALARVHTLLARQPVGAGPCPAVGRRIDALTAALPEILHPLARRMRRLIQVQAPRLVQTLLTMPGQVRLQWCLRDIWHDHLLFDGDRLTGLIDYAAAGVDSVACDLARMLGSLVGDDSEAWRNALTAYRELAPLTVSEEFLAVTLDRGGVVASLANWLRRLAGAPMETMSEQARARIEQLLERVEEWG
ncbi:MAG: aminoglycoside phosphotransferase family protein [Gemmataceae bacterium]